MALNNSPKKRNFIKYKGLFSQIKIKGKNIISAKYLKQMAIEKNNKNLLICFFRQKKNPRRVKKTEKISYPPKIITEKITSGEVAQRLVI